jgi:hypothetical protein
MRGDGVWNRWHRVCGFVVHVFRLGFRQATNRSLVLWAAKNTAKGGYLMGL